jgi:hypothetical protein
MMETGSVGQSHLGARGTGFVIYSDQEPDNVESPSLQILRMITSVACPRMGKNFSCPFHWRTLEVRDGRDRAGWGRTFSFAYAAVACGDMGHCRRLFVMSETSLYTAIKRFLEAANFDIRAR